VCVCVWEGCAQSQPLTTALTIMSQTSPPNHPNPELHQRLLDASQKGTLTAELIKNILGSAEVYEEDGATAYVNWNTTLVIEGPYRANVWFAGVSRPQDGEQANDVDILRDTESTPGKLFITDTLLKNKDRVYNFKIVQTTNTLSQWHVLVDIYSPDLGIVAWYEGPLTHKACSQELVDRDLEFSGEGLWGILIVQK